MTPESDSNFRFNLMRSFRFRFVSTDLVSDLRNFTMEVKNFTTKDGGSNPLSPSIEEKYMGEWSRGQRRCIRRFRLNIHEVNSTRTSVWFKGLLQNRISLWGPFFLKRADTQMEKRPRFSSPIGVVGGSTPSLPTRIINSLRGIFFLYT